MRMGLGAFSLNVGLAGLTFDTAHTIFGSNNN